MKTAEVLAGVGAVNWGLVGLFGINLVSMLAGTGTLSTVVYTLVGISGVYVLIRLFTK